MLLVHFGLFFLYGYSLGKIGYGFTSPEYWFFLVLAIALVQSRPDKPSEEA